MMLYRKHGTEAGATFTVRKTASGIGVERTFPLFSPMIETLEVTKRSKTRRSKLYYVRHKAAKEISKRMRMVMMTLGLKDEEAKVDNARAEAEAAEAPVVEEIVETQRQKERRRRLRKQKLKLLKKLSKKLLLKKRKKRLRQKLKMKKKKLKLLKKRLQKKRQNKD